jgi:DUF1365 family protein
MNSALYTGSIRHRRFLPKQHEFQYSIVMFCLDLAEVDRLFKIPGIFGKGRFGLLSFYRADYLKSGKSGVTLDGAVRERVREKFGVLPTGPIRILTQIRYLGFCFNPVSFYYCFDSTGTKVEFIVSEITNTPWNERFSYVLRCDENGSVDETRFPKEFHVSPFMPMELEYRWKLSAPKNELSVQMDNYQSDGKRMFVADLLLKRKPLNVWTVTSTMLLFPLLTLKTVFAIYFQALLLFVKRMPFFSHPLSGGKHGVR